jgi:hypothetical protein
LQTLKSKNDLVDRFNQTVSRAPPRACTSTRHLVPTASRPRSSRSTLLHIDGQLLRKKTTQLRSRVFGDNESH